MPAYSKEFRRDVLAACDAGVGTQAIALQFGVSESWVRRIKQQRRETGQIAPKTTRKRRPRWEVWADWLRGAVAATPDADLRELKARLKEDRSLDVDERRIGAACQALKLTQKKDARCRRAGPGRRRPGTPRVAEEAAGDRPRQVGLFLDETWAKTNMTSTSGRSPIGTRLIQKVPCSRWSTTTFLGGLRSTGFIAPLCVDGAITGQLFKAWMEQHLVRELKPGDIVVMDNLSSHKVVGIVEAIESVGASAHYLPPYSPDLNPIELAFSKFKKLLRDGAERTTDKLWSLCGRVLDLFPETECRNDLSHCGYRYT